MVSTVVVVIIEGIASQIEIYPLYLLGVKGRSPKTADLFEGRLVGKVTPHGHDVSPERQLFGNTRTSDLQSIVGHRYHRLFNDHLVTLALLYYIIESTHKRAEGSLSPRLVSRPAASTSSMLS